MCGLLEIGPKKSGLWPARLQVSRNFFVKASHCKFQLTFLEMYAGAKLGRGRGASNSRAAGAAGLLAESACALDQRSDDAGGLQLRTGPGCTSRVEVRGAEV